MTILERARELAALAEKTTRGPWTAFTDDSRYPPHTNIAAVTRKGTSLVFSLPGHDKEEPDVELIAAAPEMAELLGRLAGKLEDLLPDSMGKCPPSRRYRNCPANIDSCPDCWQEWLER